MKKRILTIVALLFMAVVPAMSQVFMTDEESWENQRQAQGAPAISVLVPKQDVEWDQFVPVGEGMVLLVGLAGAYLLGKRKKEQE